MERDGMVDGSTVPTTTLTFSDLRTDAEIDTVAAEWDALCASLVTHKYSLTRSWATRLWESDQG